MNKLLLLSGLFLICSLANLANVWLTGNGFSFVLGLVWLGASALLFARYRKEKKGDDMEETA